MIHMYNKVNIKENTLRVLALFTNGFDKDYYIREVAQLLNLSPRTAQLILEDLEKKGVLKGQSRGKIKSCTIFANEMSRRYLILAEQYKAITLMSQHLLVRELLIKMSSIINGLGIVFGSYVKGSAARNSDIDILVVGEYDPTEVKRIGTMLGIPIHIQQYSRKVFRSGVKTDLFIREVLRSHIIFKGAEEFIDTVLDNGQDTLVQRERSQAYRA
jgi:uncharacterized protein